MLQWAISFLILALVAGFLGFGGVAVLSIEIARTLFGVFIFLFILTLIVHLLQGRRPPMPPV